MEFTIKAGRHYANKMLRMRVMWGNTLSFKLKISASAQYDPSGLLNGYSKVFGMAEPFGHCNSCRLVFVSTGDQVKFGVYVYRKGVSPQEDTTLKKDLCIMIPKQEYTCKIVRYIDHYNTWIMVNNYVVGNASMPAGRWPFPFRFLLHPYIGGRFTLDKDVTIDITRV